MCAHFPFRMPPNCWLGSTVWPHHQGSVSFWKWEELRGQHGSLLLLLRHRRQQLQEQRRRHPPGGGGGAALLQDELLLHLPVVTVFILARALRQAAGGHRGGPPLLLPADRGGANGGIVLYEKVVADTYRTLVNKVVSVHNGADGHLHPAPVMVGEQVVRPPGDRAPTARLTSSWRLTPAPPPAPAGAQRAGGPPPLVLLEDGGGSRPSTRTVLIVVNVRPLHLLLSLIMCAGFGREEIFMYYPYAERAVLRQVGSA